MIACHMRSIAAFCLLILVSGFAPAQVADGKLPRYAKSALIERIVAAEMASQKIIGLAVGVLDGGKIVHIGCHGQEDRENKIPLSERTMFRWASVSKPITAVCAMQLVEAGKLDLDANIRNFVPEFPDKGAPITTRQLLCHQSGIVHYMNGKVIRTQRDYAVPHPFADVVVALDTFKESPLVARPGEKYSYSTHAYILLSAVVERAGGRRYVDQVNERIVKPLGMNSLQPDYQWVTIPHRAIGYRRFGNDFIRSSDTDVSWKLGGGGFISNIGDFARFASGLLNHKLLRESTEKTMWEPQCTADGKKTTYGLGFAVDGSGENRRVAHGGAQEKTRTRIVIYPNQGRGIVLATNCEWVNPTRLVDAIAKALAAN